MFYRRYLPHWHPYNASIFLTWRLAGSPASVGQTIAFCGLSNVSRARSFERFDAGPFWLKDPRIAAVVADALDHGQRVRKWYELGAWVIMPNHVHVLLSPLAPMPSTMRWLKGRTARVANRILQRTGLPFWQDESLDHWVRNADELRRLIGYIEDNPVRAALTSSKEEWRWPSAWTPADEKSR